MIGCTFNVVGLVAANITAPPAKASRLIGKSSEYIETYTEAYIRKAKSIQSKYAQGGCLVSSIPIGVGCLLILLGLNSNPDVDMPEQDYSGCAGP
jgi:hypothetical protein